MKLEEVICPYCNKKAKWNSNEVIYGKQYGKSYMCYYCEKCNAYVGCHNNTKEPLGTMANKELRDLRIRAHWLIDDLWKSKRMTRKNVYRCLSTIFGKDFHIAQCTVEECKNILKFDVKSLLKIYLKTI